MEGQQDKDGEVVIVKYCPICKRQMPYGKTYCDKCEGIAKTRLTEARARRARQYNRQRDSKYTRFYHSSDWQRLRAAKLSECGYLCEECKAHGVTTIAEDVHHIVPIREDWDRRLDIDNLMAVCVSCHNKIERRGGGGDKKYTRAGATTASLPLRSKNS